MGIAEHGRTDGREGIPLELCLTALWSRRPAELIASASELLAEALGVPVVVEDVAGEVLVTTADPTVELDHDGVRLLEAAGALLAASLARSRDDDDLGMYRRHVETLPCTTYIDRRDTLSSTVYISPQIEDLVGYPVAAWHDDPPLLARCLHPDDRERVLLTLREAAVTEAAVEMDYRMIRKDGRVIWVSESGVADRLADGTPVLRGTMTDITDRITNESARVAAERLYRDLVEEIPLITYVHTGDSELRMAYLSPQIEETLGHPPSTLVGPGERFLAIVHPDDRPLVRDHARRSLRGDLGELEYRIIAADGRTVWVLDRSRPQIDPSGDVRMVRGFMIDITAEKESASRHEEAELRYRTLLEEVPGVVYVDAAGPGGAEPQYISPEIERVLGYAAEDWLTKPRFFVDHVLHPDDRERILAEIAETNEGRRVQSEYRCIARDGRVLWFYDDSVPQFDQNGNVVATRGFMLDITDRKHAEEEVRKRDELLLRAQRTEAIGRLAGGVAHDFNNLLTVISGQVDVLAAHPGVSPEALDELAEIGDAARRAAELTRQLLAFGRRQVLQPTVVDLRGVVVGLTTMLRRLVGPGIELVVRGSPALAPVKVDRGQIEQVIVNLVLNARDAMPDGGTIRVATDEIANSGAPDDTAGSAARRHPLRHRPRSRHPGGRAAAHLRAVLHDEGGR